MLRSTATPSKERKSSDAARQPDVSYTATRLDRSLLRSRRGTHHRDDAAQRTLI
jgi:hypothetical protein